MSRVFLVFLFILSLASSAFSLEVGKDYSLSIVWTGQDGKGKTVASGEVSTVLIVSRIENTDLSIHITKHMTPFSEVLDFEATAKYVHGRYEFETDDNWGNKVFGYIIEKDNTLILMIDCTDFSEDGENLARLYGDTVILTMK